MENPRWTSIFCGEDSAELGTEGGIVCADDVHDFGARITLERLNGDDHFALTCGIYGWMVHTRYFNQSTLALHAFDEMKDALDAIIVAIPLETDPDLNAKMEKVSHSISLFVDKYPS